MYIYMYICMYVCVWVPDYWTGEFQEEQMANPHNCCCTFHFELLQVSIRSAPNYLDLAPAAVAAAAVVVAAAVAAAG